MPWAASRTLANVKSRAINPRQPEIPNRIVMTSKPRRGRKDSSRSFQSVPITKRKLILPIERAFLQRINVTYKQNAQERKHRSENEVCIFFEHIAIDHRPRIKKGYLDIEENEQHSNEIEFHRKPGVALALWDHSAFVGHVLGRSTASALTYQNRKDQSSKRKCNRYHSEN